MIKKSMIFIILGISLLLVAGCSSQNNNAQQLVNNDNTDNNDYIIEITESGFNPSTLTINAGETVTWINNGVIPAWPASAFHPAHNAYPGGGGCIGSKFDACRGLKQGETYSFTFNQKGAWKYHDHLSPGDTGTIIVE